jgi:hypothetical protein
MRIPAGAKPGLAPGQGALGLRLVRWSRGADAGACRCWPASAGGGVANRRRMPRIAVTGLRLGTALKQVFILEFDTMWVCAYQIMQIMHHLYFILIIVLHQPSSFGIISIIITSASALASALTRWVFSFITNMYRLCSLQCHAHLPAPCSLLPAPAPGLVQ